MIRLSPLIAKLIELSNACGNVYGEKACIIVVGASKVPREELGMVVVGTVVA